MIGTAAMIFVGCVLVVLSMMACIGYGIDVGKKGVHATDSPTLGLVFISILAVSGILCLVLS